MVYVLTSLFGCYMAGATSNCYRLGARSVYTIRRVHACLALTCHMYFWQNHRDLLHATAVTRGWNGYQNKSQHRKLTTEKKEKKKIFRRSCRDSHNRRFDHESGALPLSYPFRVFRVGSGLHRMWDLLRLISFFVVVLFCFVLS